MADFYFKKSKPFGDYLERKTVKNKIVMIVRNFMADLLEYTKKLADKISYYDALIDFTDDTHWMNPFYGRPEINVVWIENPNNAPWDI